MDISQSARDDEDRTPNKGEMTVIDGKLAMYINSNNYGATSGSRLVRSTQKRANSCARVEAPRAR